MNVIEELEKQLKNHYRDIEDWPYGKIIAHILSRNYTDKDMKIDFSKLSYSKFGENRVYKSSHQRGKKYSITFSFYGAELAKYEGSPTSLPEFIRRMITAKSASLCSSYLILYLSYQLKENIEILETVGIHTYIDLTSIIGSHDQEDLVALADQIHKNFPKIEENPFNDGAPVGYSVRELKEEGWNIEFEYENGSAYYSYVEDNAIYGTELAQQINKTPNPEYDFLFKYRRDEDSLKIRKLTTKTKIARSLSFEVTISPLFQVLQEKLDTIVTKIFSSSYMQCNKLDIILLWGGIAKSARKDDHTFEILSKENRNKYIEDAQKAKLIEKTENGKFRFCAKYFRILLDGKARGYDTNHLYTEADPQDRKQIIENVIHEIIGYGEPLHQELTDHRSFRLTEGCIFAVSLVSSVGPNLQEKLIYRLCEYAEDYSLSKPNNPKNLVTSRLYQHLCALIVSYMLLVLQRELKMNVMKRMYTACFQKQLYPAQVPIWESLKMHSEFYKEFASDAFQKSLESNDNGTMSGQPYFHFLQPLCRKPPNRLTLLDRALLSQKQSWIYPNTFDKKEFQTLVEKLKKIPTNSRFDPKEIIASQLALYSLADIRYLYNTEVSANTDSLYRFLGIKGSADDALLRATIVFDYLQRTSNPAYRCLIDVQKATKIDDINDALKKLSNDNKDFSYEITSSALENARKEGLMTVSRHMLMVCGSLRMICSYDFKSNFTLDEIQLESYKNWIDNESSSRFYFMLLRLVSFTNFFQKYETEYKQEFSSPNLAQKYYDTTFLPYDNFPTGRQGFSEFRSEIENRIKFKLT